MTKCVMNFRLNFPEDVGIKLGKLIWSNITESELLLINWKKEILHQVLWILLLLQARGGGTVSNANPPLPPVEVEKRAPLQPQQQGRVPPHQGKNVLFSWERERYQVNSFSNQRWRIQNGGGTSVRINKFW